MAEKKHVAVLMGGWSSERPVSLKSGEGCAGALERAGYRVTRVDVGRDIAEVLTKLKPDVAFHDGHTLTSADVVFSLQRHLDPDVGSKVAAIAKQMTEISAVDSSTVKVVLAEPNADLPTILALHHFMIVADGTVDEEHRLPKPHDKLPALGVEGEAVRQVEDAQP